jgi:hypothetical protein
MYKDKVSTNVKNILLSIIRCVFTNYFRYTIKLIMADVGQTGLSGEQRRRFATVIKGNKIGYYF